MRGSERQAIAAIYNAVVSPTVAGPGAACPQCNGGNTDVTDAGKFYLRCSDCGNNFHVDDAGCVAVQS